MTNPQNPIPANSGIPKPVPRFRRGSILMPLVAAFGIGGGVTAFALHGRPPTIVALTPAPIAAMKDKSPVAFKGEVAEILGNKIVVQDDSGRALVETGPRGESGKLVKKAETITVQGRFEHGFVHAVTIAHADGQTEFVGPPGPPPPAPGKDRERP
ncbi:MAG: hypothetical protein JO004_03640 [Methylobacteriaceae bacterium]|nr:hypothetical protein [Methylobacteriaceae bacterium]